MLAFSADTRRTDLQRMAEGEVDLLVIGGGITGCGIALDATSRGLSVALVEREDFASGTSGRSSRLIHGGVRYLENYEFGLVHESLVERAILLRLAPHLARPFPIYAPTPSPRQQAHFRLGLIVYDALALGRNVHRHRLIPEEEMCRAAPGLARPSAGVAYYECRSDDARLTLEVARTARSFGALVANHAAVSGLLTTGGRVRGANVVDGMTGEVFEVLARLTVNAAGVWADHVQGMATDAPRRLRPSKGVHVVFRPGAVATRVGMLVPSVAGDRRFVFMVPWAQRVYAGTTDTEYDGDLDAPQVTEEDRDYIVGAVAEAFPGVTKSDVVASWAGLRPLVWGAKTPNEPSPTNDLQPPDRLARTADLSRRHAVYEGPAGLLTVTGGKLTAYRRMAEEVVNRAARLLGVRTKCRTKTIRLGFHGDLSTELEEAAATARGLGLPEEAGRRLVYQYGDDWVEAARLIKQDASLGEAAVDGLPVLKVELELGRTREMGLTDEDVLVRRTRLTTMDEKSGLPKAKGRRGSGSRPGPGRS